MRVSEEGLRNTSRLPRKVGCLDFIHLAQGLRGYCRTLRLGNVLLCFHAESFPLVFSHAASKLVPRDATLVDQYAGKHFHNVKRKGNNVTDRIFIGQTAHQKPDRNQTPYFSYFSS